MSRCVKKNERFAELTTTTTTKTIKAITMHCNHIQFMQTLHIIQSLSPTTSE